VTLNSTQFLILDNGRKKKLPPRQWLDLNPSNPPTSKFKTGPVSVRPLVEHSAQLIKVDRFGEVLIKAGSQAPVSIFRLP